MKKELFLTRLMFFNHKTKKKKKQTRFKKSLNKKGLFEIFLVILAY